MRTLTGRFLLITLALLARGAGADGPPPNVVLFVTDDQGLGDLGFHGNPVLRTPNLDALARASARMEHFYVSPVCAPTRASLMTGRHAQRTRAIDTYLGRAMMEPAEVTLAEMLADAGWATGIFGKWHLGDCYPMRAMDQGFQESLVHRGGGIGQPSDPEGGERRYTDPVLFHNGRRVQARGFCTDAYVDAALRWMTRQTREGRPFFAYIPTNAPHGPFHDVPPSTYEHYRSQDLSPQRFPQATGQPLPASHDEDRLARIFAMVENIDENVGRLVAGLRDIGVLETTLLIFMCDNGPNTRRYVVGLRGAKGDVYEGGVRSPFLAHWPRKLPSGLASDRVTAHIDVMPTILEACGVSPPDGVRLDGRSLLPLLERREEGWRDRTLVIQAHRGDRAVRYHHMLVRRGNWKLVSPSGFHRELEVVEPRFELYDLTADPYEQRDLAAARPDVVRELQAAYDLWFDDVCRTRPDNFAPPRIHLGAAQAPTVTLTRQDWRRTSDDGGWNRRSRGHWEVLVRDAGPYTARVRFLPDALIEHVEVRLGDFRASADIAPEATSHTFENVMLPVGPGRLEVTLEDAEGTLGAFQVIFEHQRQTEPAR
jgi:arylsulfatase/arylsulfatase A